MSRAIADRKTLPSIIKIGISEYTLILWPVAEADAAECYGECDVQTYEIRVQEDLPNSHFAEILEHEINHGCWKAAKLRSRASEESVINRMTPILIAARRDNPEIYAWIDQAIAQKA